MLMIENCVFFLGCIGKLLIIYDWCYWCGVIFCCSVILSVEENLFCGYFLLV